MALPGMTAFDAPAKRGKIIRTVEWSEQFGFPGCQKAKPEVIID